MSQIELENTMENQNSSPSPDHSSEMTHSRSDAASGNKAIHVLDKTSMFLSHHYQRPSLEKVPFSAYRPSSFHGSRFQYGDHMSSPYAATIRNMACLPGYPHIAPHQYAHLLSHQIAPPLPNYNYAHFLNIPMRPLHTGNNSSLLLPNAGYGPSNVAEHPLVPDAAPVSISNVSTSNINENKEYQPENSDLPPKMNNLTLEPKDMSISQQNLETAEGISQGSSSNNPPLHHTADTALFDEVTTRNFNRPSHESNNPAKRTNPFIERDASTKKRVLGTDEVNNTPADKCNSIADKNSPPNDKCNSAGYKDNSSEKYPHSLSGKEDGAAASEQTIAAYSPNPLLANLSSLAQFLLPAKYMAYLASLQSMLTQYQICE